MEVRCPYCNKLLLKELLGRATAYCRGCKRELTLRRDRPAGPVILESPSD
jgi:hypothetical protein